MEWIFRKLKTVPIRTFLLSAILFFKRMAPMNAIVKSILFKRNNAICIVFAINFYYTGTYYCRFKMLNDEQKNDSDLGSKDASYVIDKQKMAIVLSALASGNRVDLTEVLEPLHPADIADIIEQLNTTDRARFIRLYDTEFYGDILSEIDEHIEEVIAELKPDVLAEAVRDLESDDVVDIVEDLEKAKTILTRWTRVTE